MVPSSNESTWTRISRIIQKLDEDKIKDCKEDIDTILVFAGLFATVMTALLVESYKTLQQDPTSTMVSLLQQIAVQTGSFVVAGGFVNSTLPQASINTTSTFRPTANAKRVNILWFASLVLSLATASLGIIVKQWLREYLAGEYTSAQARLRVRHFRHPQLSSWKVFEIAAVLPLLLQVSLALFLVGLCYFTAEIHESIGHTTLPLVAAWAFLLAAVTFFPVAVPACPYKTSFLKDGINISRRQMYKVLSYCFSSLLPHLLLESLISKTSAEQAIQRLLSDDEDHVVRNDKNDVDILLAVDAIQSDDQLLNDVMWEALQQVDLEPEELAGFLVSTIGHRAQCDVLATLSHSFLNLRSMPKSTYATIMDMVAGLVERQLHRLPTRSDERTARLCEEWFERSICVLLSDSKHPHSEKVNRVLHACLTDDRHQLISRFIHTRVDMHADFSEAFLSVLRRLSGGLRLIEDPKEFLLIMQQIFRQPLGLPSPNSLFSGQLIADDQHSILDDDEYFHVPPSFHPFVIELFVSRIDDAVERGLWTPSHQMLFKRTLQLASNGASNSWSEHSKKPVLRVAEKLLKSPTIGNADAVCEAALGMSKSSNSVRAAAQNVYIDVMLSMNSDDRLLLLSKFVSFTKAHFKDHHQIYPVSSSSITSITIDPLAGCLLHLRVIQRMKWEDGERNRQHKLEYFWKTIFDLLLPRLRLALVWAHAEHRSMAIECLELIDKIQPWTTDDQQLEDWKTVAVLAIRSSIFTDELVQALADFLPYPTPILTWRVRRLKLLETQRPGEKVITASGKPRGIIETVPVAVLAKDATDGASGEEDGESNGLDGEGRVAELIAILKKFAEDNLFDEGGVRQTERGRSLGRSFPIIETAPEQLPNDPAHAKGDQAVSHDDESDEVVDGQRREGDVEEDDALEAAFFEPDLARMPMLANLYSAFGSPSRRSQKPLSMKDFAETLPPEDDWQSEPDSPDTTSSREQTTLSPEDSARDMANTPMLASLLSHVGVSGEGQLYTRANGDHSSETVDPLVARILQALGIPEEPPSDNFVVGDSNSRTVDSAQHLVETSEPIVAETSPSGPSNPFNETGPLPFPRSEQRNPSELLSSLELHSIPPADDLKLPDGILSVVPALEEIGVFLPSSELASSASGSLPVPISPGNNVLLMEPIPSKQDTLSVTMPHSASGPTSSKLERGVELTPHGAKGVAGMMSVEVPHHLHRNSFNSTSGIGTYNSLPLQRPASWPSTNGLSPSGQKSHDFSLAGKDSAPLSLNLSQIAPQDGPETDSKEAEDLPQVSDTVT